MKSKIQKTKEVEEGVNLANKSKSLILVNFSKIPVNATYELKSQLREIGAKMKVMKKTLLSLIFQKKDVDIDATQFSGQIATIFSDDDIVNPAGVVYKFAKDNKEGGYELNMVAGYNLAEGVLYDSEKMTEFGKLPSREILLAQLVGMISAPIRSLAVVLNQISEQKNSESKIESDTEEKEEQKDKDNDAPEQEKEEKKEGEEVEEKKEEVEESKEESEEKSKDDSEEEVKESEEK